MDPNYLKKNKEDIVKTFTAGADPTAPAPAQAMFQKLRAALGQEPQAAQPPVAAPEVPEPQLDAATAQELVDHDVQNMGFGPDTPQVQIEEYRKKRLQQLMNGGQ